MKQDNISLEGLRAFMELDPQKRLRMLAGDDRKLRKQLKRLRQVIDPHLMHHADATEDVLQGRRRMDTVEKPKSLLSRISKRLENPSVSSLERALRRYIFCQIYDSED